MVFIQKFSLVTCLISVLLIASTVEADVYRYIDKRGRVVLTDKQPNEQYLRLVKTWKGWVPQNASSARYQNLEKNKHRHAATISLISKRYNLPKSLIEAVITAESAYDSEAVSRAGAVGLMQLMPETAKRYGVKNRRDPYQNVNGGTQYLRDLLILFKDDLQLALAAYNAGEGTVKKYNYQIPPYKETQHYVKKVIAFYNKYKSK